MMIIIRDLLTLYIFHFIPYGLFIHFQKSVIPRLSQLCQGLVYLRCQAVLFDFECKGALPLIDHFGYNIIMTAAKRRLLLFPYLISRFSLAHLRR